MTVRRLPPEEWSLAEKFFLEHFKEVPPIPQVSCIVVAEEEGRIIGALAAQMMTHIEPLGVRKGYETRGVVPQLIMKMRELLPDLNVAYSTCLTRGASKLLDRLGFRQMPWLIYRWVKDEQSHGDNDKSISADKRF